MSNNIVPEQPCPICNHKLSITHNQTNTTYTTKCNHNYIPNTFGSHSLHFKSFTSNHNLYYFTLKIDLNPYVLFMHSNSIPNNSKFSPQPQEFKIIKIITTEKPFTSIFPPLSSATPSINTPTTYTSTEELILHSLKPMPILKIQPFTTPKQIFSHFISMIPSLQELEIFM